MKLYSSLDHSDGLFLIFIRNKDSEPPEGSQLLMGFSCSIFFFSRLVIQRSREACISSTAAAAALPWKLIFDPMKFSLVTKMTRTVGQGMG
jgi:hypothetical protein